jgi:hypothetical protein
VRSWLQSLIAQAVEDGELPAVDDEAVALSLAALLEGLGMHALVDPEVLTPAVLHQQVEVFLATIWS